jgi:hypothetical protein
VDHVVADIHRVDALGQQLDAVGVLEAGLLEGAGPPGRAGDQRRAHRLRRTAVDVVDDRLLDGADGRRRVGLFQAMPHLPVHVDAAGQRRGEIEVADIEAAGIRMISTRTPAALLRDLRQAHHADTLAHRQAGRFRRDLAHVVRLTRSREGQHRLQFDVVGEGLGLVGQHRAARRIDRIGALLGRGQARCDAVTVGQQETGEVDQMAVLVAGENLARPQHRTGKRFLDGRALVAVGRGGDIGRIVLYQEQPGAVLFKMNHAHLAGLAAIEADIVRAQRVWQGTH